MGKQADLGSKGEGGGWGGRPSPKVKLTLPLFEYCIAPAKTHTHAHTNTHKTHTAISVAILAETILQQPNSRGICPPPHLYLTCFFSILMGGCARFCSIRNRVHRRSPAACARGPLAGAALVALEHAAPYAPTPRRSKLRMVLLPKRSRIGSSTFQANYPETGGSWTRSLGNAQTTQ